MATTDGPSSSSPRRASLQAGVAMDDAFFDSLRAIWTRSSAGSGSTTAASRSKSTPSHPSSPYAPLLLPILLVAPPSFPQTAQDLVLDAFRHTVHRLAPYGGGSGDDTAAAWGDALADERLPPVLRVAMEEEDGKGDDDEGLKHKLAQLSGTDIAVLVLTLRVREALVKSWPLVGFPRLIAPLSMLSAHLSSAHAHIASLVTVLEHKVKVNTPTTLVNLHAPNLHPDAPRPPVSRGMELFESTYERHASKVLHKLGSAHPSLPTSALSLIYTPVLSKDEVLLPHPLLTSLLSLEICFALGLAPQTKGHLGGARNSLRKWREANDRPRAPAVGVGRGGVAGSADDASTTPAKKDASSPPPPPPAAPAAAAGGSSSSSAPRTRHPDDERLLQVVLRVADTVMRRFGTAPNDLDAMGLGELL